MLAVLIFFEFSASIVHHFLLIYNQKYYNASLLKDLYENFVCAHRPLLFKRQLLLF